jgi:hypothetical protein
MASITTHEQAAALLYQLLLRVSEIMPPNLSVSKDIRKALADTALFVGDNAAGPRLDETATAPAPPAECPNCEFGSTHTPKCPRVSAPPAVRAEFETHMTGRDKAVMLEKRPDGSYASWFTDRYWMTWIAAYEWMSASAGEDTKLMDWLDGNILHREKSEWDARGAPDSNMWVIFAPSEVQGSARKIVAAARDRDQRT